MVQLLFKKLDRSGIAHKYHIILLYSMATFNNSVVLVSNAVSFISSDML